MKGFAEDTDSDGLINALDNDSDGDGIQDGTELGYTTGVPYLSANGNTIKGTDGSIFIPDQDPSPVNNTDPLSVDTDMDGLVDGWIDNGNGIVEIGEGEDFNLNGKWDIGLAVGPNNVYETNANDSDADDDGIMDGDETNTSLGFNTDPMDWDSDDDGLSDGTEVGYTLEDMPRGTDISTGHFIPDADPYSKTEPLIWDTDGDGLGDGFVDDGDGIDEWTDGEDKNWNGAVDFNETSPISIDTDEDGLLDGYDCSTYDNSYKPEGITIFYENTAQVYWGELSHSTHNLTGGSNNYFQDSSTDPTVNDSDGDGLIDGPTQGQRKGELVRDPYYHASQNCMLDPSVMDTDTDGLSDGLEVSGWDINIIWEKTKEKERTYTAYGLPARWDTTNDTFFTDFDNDGLTDFDEFQNTSDPFVDDTDGDHILDGNEGPGNATQIEGSDPEIVGDIEAEFVFEYGEFLGIKIPKSMYIRVLVWVKDNAGIDWVEIECQGRNPKRIEYVPFIDGDPDRAIPVEANFQADFVGAFWSGYDIKVKVADVNGNGVSGKSHFDSVAEAVIKAILAALEAFVKAVTELASKMFEWIWGVITSVFEKVFEPIRNAIVELIRQIGNRIYESFSKYLENKNEGRGTWDSISNFIFSGKVWAMFTILAVAIEIGIGVLGAFLKVVSMGSDILLSQMIRPLLNFIISTIVAQFYSAGIVTATIIITLLYPFIAQDDAFWDSGIGLDIISLSVAISSFALQ